MKAKILPLVILISLISCDGNENFQVKTISKFPKSKELNARVVDVEELPSCPKNILVIGQKVVLLNQDNCDNEFVYVYDKESFNFIGSFGTYGRGPNELVAPYTSKQVVLNDSIEGFWIGNQKNNRYELIDINKSLQKKMCIVGDHYWASVSEGLGMYSFRVDEENIIVYSLSGIKGRFYSHNLKEKTTKWVGFFPEIQNNIPPHPDNKVIIYDSNCAFSEDGKYFVTGVNLAKRIDVFTSQLDHKISIAYNDSPKEIRFNRDNEADWHNNYSHFLKTHITNEHIFVLFYKRSLSGRRTKDDPEMHVFSLDGNAIVRYKLKNVKYYDFTIDQESKNIYCLINDEEGFPKIIMYAYSI